MTISSHTLVKNGQPFIGGVLDQVAQFVDTCKVTLSSHSDMKTVEDVVALARVYPEKFTIFFENVDNPGELTQQRQKMIDNTKEDWILFLDDDDWWPEDSLKEMIALLDKNEDVDAYSVNPFQLLPDLKHDWKWRHRSFTKWFRNVDINYRHPWPRDLIYKGDTLLNWRKNPRVPRIPTKFFHLSAMKAHTFRDEPWAKKFAFTEPMSKDLPITYINEARKIYIYT